MLRATAALIASLFSLAGCATVPQSAPTPTIYVMRHLNTPAGVTNPDLTNDGQLAAVALVDWFKHRDPPAVIYVSNTKRAQQTAAPLARTLGIAPKVYDPADTPALIANIMREAHAVLVVGHSNTVPEIIERLGGQRPAPLVHEDFGDIWQLKRSPKETLKFRVQN